VFHHPGVQIGTSGQTPVGIAQVVISPHVEDRCLETAAQPAKVFRRKIATAQYHVDRWIPVPGTAYQVFHNDIGDSQNLHAKDYIPSARALQKHKPNI